MDGKGSRKELTDTLVERFVIDSGYDKPKGIVVGFISACEFAETGEIIANLAYLLSSRGYTVCAVDFKVFYPNLFDWLGGVAADKKGDGLLRLLNSDRTEIKSVANETDDKRVFLIAPSPNDDIEDYLNIDINDIKRVTLLLKETFDIVLIDIPNNPPLEFCAGAIMNCQKGFFVVPERIDAPRNMLKLLNFTSKFTNNAESFNNIILSHKHDMVYDENVLTEEIKREGKDSIKLRMVARIPFIKESIQCALDGKVYIKDGSFVTRKLMGDGKRFNEEMTYIAEVILGGVAGADA
jgi:MinD-like ATPase involved in chromosome partitioning or flagellar assembly